jgi:ethanolamine utilization protein EutA
MSSPVQLVGLDFGSTTSNALVASAKLIRSVVTGRVELSHVCESFRSELVFTPFDQEDHLDLAKVEELLDRWLAAGGVRPPAIFGGGALLTGLTAQRANAPALVELIRRRLGEALIATADDPCLESWLAFMGSCSGLSRAHPDQAILNLDIGGGTTNLALGKAGEVLRTGCLIVGARHIQITPGGYHLVRISPYARSLLDHLEIRKGPRDQLAESEVRAVLDFYLTLLQAAVEGNGEPFREPVAHLHEQVPFRRPADMMDVAVTFSGGVGELVYGHVSGKPWPPPTHFGDLGIDLAQRIVQTPFWSGHLRRFRPASAGRATVYGLLRHSTEVSGSTLFLPRPEFLPLADVPILGRLSASSAPAQIHDIVELVRRSPGGGCVQVEMGGQGATAVRALGQRIAKVLREDSFPASHPLVLLVPENLGKALGHYVTEWGALALKVVVIDEVAVRDAQYVRIGAQHGQVVPISFYGLNEQGDTP